MPISERAGVSLLVLTVSIVLLAIGLSVVMPRADLEVRRSREDDLRFKLGEFRRAVNKFERCHNRPPVDLQELLSDAEGRRFLRRPYSDPMTGTFDWQCSIASDGALVVHSASDQPGINGVPYRDFR
ncbi:MAG TPA: hypothetical protein PLM07_10925 [Candidatus Rifleibacterium sp.]|nr:hypothetical protein [Candidatus Rifleibacterium sp.]HPT46405.1 hypothetical protein [Candidatus Rifleibacterium sp.]